MVIAGDPATVGAPAVAVDVNTAARCRASAEKFYSDIQSASADWQEQYPDLSHDIKFTNEFR